ncbi:F0F1 ATP synthase subunit epsilon [Granulicatella sp. zg-ZJ]|nr:MULTISPECIES: F0F1 ATP synthase subunit epsilon [unclassified Granulicatella]MBS4749977.1 F0F1 ATP synthase subunit epsilon [Carnobacteriaceae bacterium zg-ZUI78]NEW63099.1 F0F1 ATP synthase subunit epsilon [Granulicatella sp. zg-ZJ]NEW66175.1 F0F1 ATP synthase subunit epsilon [Granulicatella sp. zg-84]QMI86068.1 F0F1 ATP synthase subunit epsilon [Carnobacteriaceae bacterium zg-84]
MSEEKLIRVNIVTPDGVVFTHRAQYVSVKTPIGGLTILPNHIPIVTTLSIGPVTIKRRQDKGFENYVAVNGGMLQFSNNVCNIVADTAERARDIDRERAERAKERAERALHEAEELHDMAKLNRAKIALNKAINRIGVSSRYGK